MNPHLIKRLFKNPSASLLAANAHDYGESNPDGLPPSSVPQQAVRHEPLAAEERKAGDTGRFPVRVTVTSYRQRLIDPDNLCPKYFVDACRYSRLIRDDSAKDIEFTARQVKVATKAEQRTEIEIFAPEES